MEENKEVTKETRKKRNNVEQMPKKIKVKLPEIKKIKTKQTVYGSLVILIIAIVMCIINYDKLGLVLNKKITDNDAIQIDLISSNNKLYAYQNEVLVCNSEGILSYNKYGQKTWELDMKGAVDDHITTNEKYIQVINQDKSVVYVYKDKYETARIKVDGTILSGNINSKGYSVIEYTSTGNKTVLAVYDNKGNLKYNVKLSNNIIGQYILSKDSKYLAYVDVNIQGISVASSVMLVELKGRNKESVEELHTADNSLIYDLTFSGNNLIYKLDEEIIIQNLNSREKEVSTIENESVVSVDIDEKKYSYIIFEDGIYSLGIRTIGGKEKKNIEIHEMPKYFVYEKGNVFVGYQKKLCVYNSLKMKIKEYNSSMVITEPVVYSEGRSVAFLVSNKLVMFNI